MKKRLLCIVTSLVIILTLIVPTVALAKDELKNTDPDKYYVLVDLNNQFITVYEKDDAGEYTRVVRRMLCSTGKEGSKEIGEDGKPVEEGTPTATGIWEVGGKERFGKFAKFGGEYARYWTQVVESIFMHSVMFGKRDVDHLKSGAYGRLGNKASHGCIRMYIEDAKWAYYYLAPGTKVNVSDKEKKQPEIRKKLKSKIPFKEYNEWQKKFYDEPELPNDKAWVAVDDAPMRKGCGLTDGTMMKLEKDAEVELLQVGNPWVKIKYNDREGYMRRAYITFEKGVLQSREDSDVIKGTTWMYTEPDSDSTRMAKITTQTAVEVLEVKDDWTKVRFTGEEGWIQSRSLKKDWGVIVEY